MKKDLDDSILNCLEGHTFLTFGEIFSEVKQKAGKPGGEDGRFSDGTLRNRLRAGRARQDQASEGGLHHRPRLEGRYAEGIRSASSSPIRNAAGIIRRSWWTRSATACSGLNEVRRAHRTKPPPRRPRSTHRDRAARLYWAGRLSPFPLPARLTELAGHLSHTRPPMRLLSGLLCRTALLLAVACGVYGTVVIGFKIPTIGWCVLGLLPVARYRDYQRRARRLCPRHRPLGDRHGPPCP